MIILVFTAGVILNLFSQNYIVKYQDFVSKDCDSATLIFNATEWIYKEYHTPSAAIVTINGAAVSADDFEFSEKLKTQKSPQYTLFSYHSLQANEYLKQLGGYVIQAPMNRLDWTISPDSTKTFGDYHCLMATADLCGVSVQVWFAPEIPVSCGPDRFWGLPGLIVSVKSDDGKIFLELLSLRKTENAPTKPQILKTFTKEQYWEMKKEGEAKLTREILSLNSESSKISVSIPPTTDHDKCLLE
ncbi:MAG: GLPGLI family protein [Paludibacter sp.]|nr:GLPGLI family protein [Paludibacter sp.]